MKKIISILTMGVLLTLVSSSCNKDFINIPPVSSVSTDALYKTNTDFLGAMVAIYNTYQSQETSSWRFGELVADDCWDELRKGNLLYDSFTYQSNDGSTASAWNNYYAIITRCNLILDKIAPLSITQKDQFIGEAKFLRALAYFSLVRIFGDVPMITKPITLEEGYKAGRTAKASVYSTVIIPDLIDAAAKLPVTWTGANVGRPTQGAAKSILGRVYMFQSDFVKAEAILKEVVDAGTYKLVANYMDLWWDPVKGLLNEHHTEYIFDIEYEKGISEGNGLANSQIPKDTKLATFYGVTGGGTDDYNIPPGTFAIFPAGDLRKDIEACDSYVNNGVVIKIIPTANNASTFQRKYLFNVVLSGDSPVNIKVIRYADVLLMYAEALNENGKTSTALTYLNMIRARARAIPGATASATPDITSTVQATVRDAIAMERRLELGAENVRFWDLVRTGKALTTLASLGMKANNTIWPVPLAQVQIMNDAAIFPQNPGY